MMLRIENGKRLKKDVKIQFRERCLETYRTYRKFNTIQKTFANRLYVNSTSIRSKFISSTEIQSREKRRTNKTRNWYLFRRSRSDKLSRVILILTFSLTLSHSHTHVYVHCFHRRVENISCRIDRPIERSAVARIVTMQFAWRGREGGGRGIGCWREKMTRSRVVFTRPGLVIVVRQMFQLAVYAAIVVLTRHKIPIVSRGGEKREGGREAFRGLPCVTLIHRAFQHQAGLAGGEGRGGDVEFPRSLAGIYSSGVFTVNARCCYMCHERVTFCFLAGEK